MKMDLNSGIIQDFVFNLYKMLYLHTSKYIFFKTIINKILENIICMFDNSQAISHLKLDMFFSSPAENNEIFFVKRLFYSRTRIFFININILYMTSAYNSGWLKWYGFFEKMPPRSLNDIVFYKDVRRLLLLSVAYVCYGIVAEAFKKKNRARSIIVYSRITAVACTHFR